jgi:CubicO group peptidase (beta-lactamase class C family)
MIRIDRRTFLAGAAGSLLVPAAAAAGASRTDLAGVAEEIAKAGQAELGVKGLAVGVLSPAGSHVAGAGDTGRGAAPDGSTIFAIGSVTKTFTALTLARAVDAGRVGYDDPVQRHLPDGFDVPVRGGRPITLADLATQTSGLPRLPAGMESLPGFDARDPYAAVTPDALARALRETRLLSTPGRRFHYSNFGEGLLGLALAHRRGLGYGPTVREAVGAPLGLDDVVIDRDPGQVARSALGHDAKGRPTPDWRFAALAGAGALYGTAADLLGYLRAHVTLRPARMAAALRAVRRPRARVDERTRIGLAWFRSSAPGVGPFAWHNGITAGFASFVGFAPAKGLGVVALANSGIPVDSAGIAALRAVARVR